MIEFLMPAFLLGALGAGHCLGMCGGISAALSFAIKADDNLSRVQILTAYNFGRISSYAIAGALVAAFSAWIVPSSGIPLMRILAGSILILMALYLADIWRALTLLEKLGKHVWILIKPLADGLMPVDNVIKAYFFGVVWGWLPCGLIYSALALAVTQSQAWQGAALMLAFGVGTLPAVFLGGLASVRLKAILQHRTTRYGSALLMLAFGLWTIGISVAHLGHDHSHSHTSEPGLFEFGCAPSEEPLIPATE